MKTIHYSKETKAIKQHICNYCLEPIYKGDLYMLSTHKLDSDIYSWKSHKLCDMLVHELDIEGGDEGITSEHFQESVSDAYFDYISSKFSKEEIDKYSVVFGQLHNVRFRSKLHYVIQELQIRKKLKMQHG